MVEQKTLAEAWQERQDTLEKQGTNGKFLQINFTFLKVPTNSMENETNLNIFAIEIISNYAAIVYRTTAKTVGEEASKITPQRPIQHGFNGKFSTVS